jgi:hypothetical protein
MLKPVPMENKEYVSNYISVILSGHFNSHFVCEMLVTLIALG